MLQPLMENREKQMQFIAAASHELRSPITVILSNLTACRSGLIPNDDSFLALSIQKGPG
ncbi:MAG: histidine kinase dimerization/phospho-acceptor domain-containing protein [Lachnospiraceae bacterium]